MTARSPPLTSTTLRCGSKDAAGEQDRTAEGARAEAKAENQAEKKAEEKAAENERGEETGGHTEEAKEADREANIKIEETREEQEKEEEKTSVEETRKGVVSFLFVQLSDMLYVSFPSCSLSFHARLLVSFLSCSTNPRLFSPRVSLRVLVFHVSVRLTWLCSFAALRYLLLCFLCC